ncbi:MAG: ComF family protein [Syntrophaceae bacterium]|nr:ComF family protein [Syntrophaceae bacterium]
MICNLRDIGSGLVDLIFPPRCSACGKVLKEEPITPFCEACRSDFDFCDGPLCPTCGTPFADRMVSDHPCGPCLLSPPPFDASRSVAAYRGVLQETIHRLKYGRDITLAESLGQTMADFSYPLFDIRNYEVIMPVPLHVRRLRERRFNQSLLMARTIAKRHRLKLDYLSLTRTRDTAPQVSFGRQQRELNVKGVFTVVDPKRVKGKRIVIVDDVLTTGSTTRECARSLKRSGAAAVAVLTLCRTLH